jgi:hypothetical protein
MGFESYRRSAEDLRSEGNAQKKDKDLRTRVHAVFKRNLRPKNCRGEGRGLQGYHEDDDIGPKDHKHTFHIVIVAIMSYH